MKTLLLDEVEAGESYEIVITTLHGGSLVRYRIGDMVRITSLRNEKLGINIPQMTFERRVDDVIDLFAVRLSEKTIWQAIDATGIPYEDWIACKDKEDQALSVFIELKNGFKGSSEEIAGAIYENLTSGNTKKLNESVNKTRLTDMADFRIDVKLLPQGTFDNYKDRKQREGADLAHFKPPHINPSEKVMGALTNDAEEIVVVKKSGITQTAPNR
jgi:phenylacetate-coenzyme A ligase PaaK-like adenylate-forming protein